jgi:hypothetical protein
MFGTALDFCCKCIRLNATGLDDDRNARLDRLFDAGIRRRRRDRLEDNGIDLLGDQILDIRELLLLVEAGIANNKLADPRVASRRSLGFMGNLHRPGIGIDAKTAEADDPGRILLVFSSGNRGIVVRRRREAVHQLDFLRP